MKKWDVICKKCRRAYHLEGPADATLLKMQCSCGEIGDVEPPRIDKSGEKAEVGNAH